MSQKRAGNVGELLELTVSKVLGESVEALIDQGKRFTIINDDQSEEGIYYDNGFSEG